MSSDTDQPRQRTVAELLAENGGTGSTGRRRRRREADGPDDAAQSADRPAGAAPPRPDRYPPTPSGRRRSASPPDSDRAPGHRGAQGAASPTRGGDPLGGGGVSNSAFRNGVAANGVAANGAAPNGVVPNGAAPNGAAPNGAALNGFGPAGNGYGRSTTVGSPDGRPAWAPEPAPPSEPRTEQMPRVRDGRRPPIDDATGPIDRYSAEATTALPQRSAEATTALPQRSASGPAPAAPRDARDRDDADGGPPTILGAPPLGDPDDEDRAPEGASPRRAAISYDGGPPTQAAPMDLDDYDDEDWDDHPAGLADDDAEKADEEPEKEPRGRLGRGAAGREESSGSAWAAVFAQWIAGAIAGATLWVGFRYLWFNLPVVALAAAVLVTVGLVLGVRTLLRNDDLRTTIFAVLVGLLLTVSPAILVLLGR
ncbi:hypothetical protein [Pseudonocardia acidicola]|uniref:Uncharacterized protein n=1 Tax=Pseudonocardia acidicola TaxID=2724939 RepID=A0ABX1SAT0_9PSEU|nr:hypothetical protein [Pseudonocardia acidicola]NMH98024.1 hypothetical protein [Pseudonocardia acidicola]